MYDTTVDTPVPTPAARFRRPAGVAAARRARCRALGGLAALALLTAGAPQDVWTEKLLDATDAAYSAGSYRRALRKLDEAQSRSQENSGLQARAIGLRARVLDALGRKTEARAHEDYLARHFEESTASEPAADGASDEAHPTWISLEECQRLFRSDENFWLDIEAIAKHRVLRPPEQGPALGCMGFGRKFEYWPDVNPPRFFHHP